MAQNDIFTPQSALPVNDQLAAYRQTMQQLISGGANAKSTIDDQETNSSLSQNPWAPDEVDPQELSKKKDNHSAWLDTQPVAAQKTNEWNDGEHENIMRNLERDSLIHDIGDNYFDTLETIRQHYENDKQTLGPEQAHQNMMSYMKEMEPMMHDALDRHHGKDKVSHTQSLTVDPDLHVQPQLAKKGGK